MYSILTLGRRSRVFAFSILVLWSSFAGAGTPPVGTAITITKQPTKQLDKTVGKSATFSVTATGSPLFYQWQINGADIDGATGSSLTISPIPYSYYDNGNLDNPGSNNITVVVFNNPFSVTSAAAPFTVLNDVKKPTVTAVVPGNGKSYPTNAVPYELWIGGKAIDDVAVTNVSYSLNDAPYESATITSSYGVYFYWTNAVTVKPGTNTLSLFSTDYSGQNSSTQNITFFYDVWSPFTLQIESIPTLTGPGTNSFIIKSTASPKMGTNSGGFPLLVGRGYKLTVVPDISNGYIFTNITAYSDEYPEDGVMLDYLYDQTFTLDYVMESNMVMTVHFVTNLFRVHQGLYNGLFAEGDETRHDASGYITLKTTEKRGFSGKLLLEGDSVGFSGKFDIDGFAFIQVPRFAKLNKADLLMVLGMDFEEETESIFGGMINFDDGWSSELIADRLVWGKTWENTTNQSTTYSNAYTMVLPGFADTNEGPAGFSHASVLVDNMGVIKLAGLTADGQKISQKTTISKEGYWPLMVQLYADTNDTNVFTGKPIKRKRGLLHGFMEFQTNNVDPLLSSNVNLAPLGGVTWIKTAWTNVNWSSGFTNDAVDGIDVISSVHIPKAPGIPLYTGATTNFLATMSEGGLGDFSNLFFLTTNNTFGINAKNTTVDPSYNHKFTVTLANKKGSVNGTFTNELGMKLKWSGVMLQDYTNGYGFFLSTNLVNGSGKVTLENVAPPAVD